MKRTKLISQGRLPDLYQTPRQVTATYKARQMVFPDRSVSIGKFLSNGAFGMVFVNADYIIKLEIANEPKLLELDLTNWAGESGYGPTLRRWGRLNIKRSDFDELIAEMSKSAPQIVPYWFEDLGVGDPSVYYIIMDRWDMDLRVWTMEKGSLEDIAPEVMGRFVEGIRELHKLGIVHMDLLPKNILVKLDENDEVVELGMTDFGNSQLRREWFFLEQPGNRKLFTDYFVLQKEAQDIGRFLYKTKPSASSSSKDAAEFWLANEPFNFDWVVPQTYQLARQRAVLNRIPQLKFPCRFNFRLPWSELGFLEVSVRSNGETMLFGKIFGLWSLVALRAKLQEKFPQLKGKSFVWSLGTKTYRVARAEEKDFCVSTVVRKDSVYFIEFL